MSAAAPTRPSRLVILISGNGTNLQAVLDACAAGKIAARVVAVFSNQADAYGLQRARQAGVPAFHLQKTREMDRGTYDTRLGDQTAAFSPDWVLLLGWMRILSTAFLDRFPGRVVNLHPALPGAFPGTHAIERAWDAYRCGEIDRTGVMVHLVPDERVDCGPVLGQKIVPIDPDDSLETLEDRIHQAEHALVIQVLSEIL
ncbi:MAG TPA: phosphoribosylglycinamide formyltransferase [Anaerolineaceae bacterium]|nr:phosphoribosylglycinamide formyltransferase [Anaerolineaceae bacterium]